MSPNDRSVCVFCGKPLNQSQMKTEKNLVSVIMPVHNETDCIVPVLDELYRVLESAPLHEIIVVDDGSTDGSSALIADFAASHPGVRALRLEPNAGQSAAFWAGIQAATGDFIVLMDADGQNDPADIKRLVASLDEADICCGYRARRNDSPSRRLASRLANAYRRAILGDEIIDTGCSLKAFRAPMLKHLQYWDGMHRFLPMLASLRGARIVQIPVAHRSRMAGKSKYTNFHRLKRTLRDLRGVAWLKSRTRPFAVTDIQTSPSDKRSGQDSSEQ